MQNILMKFSQTQTNPEVSIWSPDLPDIELTRPVLGRFYVHICSSFVIIISFICWCISFHYYQNLAPEYKKYPHQEKLPRSWPDPFSGSRTGLSPYVSKIWPRYPNFWEVAQSGPGIPTVWGTLLVFTLHCCSTVQSDHSHTCTW